MADLSHPAGTRRMKAPPKSSTQYITQGGVTYSPDHEGRADVFYGDVPAMLAVGFTFSDKDK